MQGGVALLWILSGAVFTYGADTGAPPFPSSLTKVAISREASGAMLPPGVQVADSAGAVSSSARGSGKSDPDGKPKQTQQEQEIEKQAQEWSGGGPLKPLGYVGRPPVIEAVPDRDFIPLEDRWRIGFPDWDRYTVDKPGEYPYQHGHWWDPYDQNVLKGDYPIVGQHTFLDVTLVSDTIWDFVRLPTASGVSTQVPGSQTFFGGGDQNFVFQNFVTSFDLFHGDAGFKPLDWEFKFTPVFDINYLGTQERGIVNINPADGTTRTNGHVGIQELFGQYKIADLSPYYDTISVRGGIQGFTSDFRGFIYSDNEPGALIFGNHEANRDQWNIAYFRQLEKDTNSGLNRFSTSRDQNVILANFTRQDFIWDGYSAQLDFAYNNDNPSTRYDDNGFLVRPAYIGTIRRHATDVAYFGVTGDGHIGRVNVSNAFYEAYGRDDFNEIAGHSVTVNAQMGALELSYDRDWLRYKFSFFYASGSGNPKSRTATGFDTIFGKPDFAGAPFSFWYRPAIKLPGTGVNLKNSFSLVPDLRSSIIQGQANFVNPGLLLFNAGLDAKITPKLKAAFNFNFIQFDRVAVLEAALHQNNLGHNVGFDISLGANYRPLLIDNVIFTGGFAVFAPLAGFRDIYNSQSLLSSFTAVTLTY